MAFAEACRRAVVKISTFRLVGPIPAPVLAYGMVEFHIEEEYDNRVREHCTFGKLPKCTRVTMNLTLQWNAE